MPGFDDPPLPKLPGESEYMDVYSRDASGKPTAMTFRESPEEKGRREQMMRERSQRSADVGAALRQHWADQEAVQPQHQGLMDRVRGLFHDRRGE